MLGNANKVVDDAMMYSSEAYQNQMMSLLSNSSRGQAVFRCYVRAGRIKHNKLMQCQPFGLVVRLGALDSQ